MQTQSNVSLSGLATAFATIDAPAIDAPAIDARIVSPEIAAKAAKLAAKRKTGPAKSAPEPIVAPVKAKTAKPAKPTNAKREAETAARNEQIALARAVAAHVVGQHYDGASMPFKAAGTKLRPLNSGSRVCGLSKRQSALLQCLALYGSNAFAADGSFQRDAFRVPAHKLNPTAPKSLLVSAQPESGCVSDGRTVNFDFDHEPSYSSATRIRLLFDNAFATVQSQHGDKAAHAFRSLLASYGVEAAIAHAAQSAIGKAQPKAKRAA